MLSDFRFLCNPVCTQDLLRFYLIWISVLMLLHILWDVLHPATTFNIENLRNKVSQLYSSATATSSFLMVIIMWYGFRSHPLFSSDAVYVPLVISAASGLLEGLSGLVPVKATA